MITNMIDPDDKPYPYNKPSVPCKIRLPNGREMDILIFQETPNQMKCNLVDPSGCDIMYALSRSGAEIAFILGSKTEQMSVANFHIHVTPIDGEFVVTSCGIDLRVPKKIILQNKKNK